MSAVERRLTGLSEYATPPHRSVIGDSVEFHFRGIGPAVRFVERFPSLRLADETAGPLWWLPEIPHGRR
jgi:hypothetical protein